VNPTPRLDFELLHSSAPRELKIADAAEGVLRPTSPTSLHNSLAAQKTSLGNEGKGKVPNKMTSAACCRTSSVLRCHCTFRFLGR
jgi:hypothetical protein